ncbi:MAG: GTPase HflX [Conchiformibius sp.]|nr:GTPase HflX [Conchiformibius sp.]
MTRRFSSPDKSLDQAERIMLLGVMFAESFSGSSESRERHFRAALEEAAELVRATGGELVCTETAKRDRPHPALLVGTGKAEEWAAAVRAHNIGLVVVNHELSPTQERNLEKVLQCRVLDRVGLILAIFAQRAQSQEGKLQVELAQLSHLAGRLVRGYGHLQSQKGGIGLKGPGETQLETDRRLIQTRINSLRRRLADVKKQRATRRKARLSGSLKTVALVGYTNAGKSTLFNRLTKADVLAKDQLFATLDTTARRLYLNPQCSVVLTDTVGFVQNLPHRLVSAFAATLEETALADLLLHVADVSHPEYERQIQDVNDVLAEIGADKVPQILLLNKTDRLPEAERQNGVCRNAAGETVAVRLSARDGGGLDALRQVLAEQAQIEKF